MTPYDTIVVQATVVGGEYNQYCVFPAPKLYSEKYVGSNK